LVTSLVLTIVANSLVLSAAPASAKPRPKPVAVQVVDAQTLTPRQLSGQIKAADALRA